MSRVTWSPSWAPHVVGTYDQRAVDPETGAPEEQKFEICCQKCGARFGPTVCTSGLVRKRIASFALAHGHGRKPLDEKVRPR